MNIAKQTPQVGKTEFLNCEHNSFYVFKGGTEPYQILYLHKDGTWHDQCGESNFWATEKEAKEFLDSLS